MCTIRARENNGIHRIYRHTGRTCLIGSDSLTKFYFKLSGNLNYIQSEAIVISFDEATNRHAKYFNLSDNFELTMFELTYDKKYNDKLNA